MFDFFDMYKKIFESSSHAIIIFDADGFITCNEQTAKYLGLASVEDFKTLNPFEIIPPYQPDGTLSHIKYEKYLLECDEKGEAEFKWLYKTLKGEDLYVNMSLKKIASETGVFYVAKWRNENELKELEREIKNQTLRLNKKKAYIEQIKHVFHGQNIDTDKVLDTIVLLNEYKKVIDETTIVSKADKKGIITFVNDKFCEISGYDREELVGSPHNVIRHPDMDKKVFKELWKTILNKEIFRGIIKNKRKDGSAYYVDTSIVPILNENNEIIEFMAIRHDLTKIYEQEKIIKEQYLDELTQLPNRQRLIKDLKEALNKRLVLIDIGRFRDINDFYGFEAGDLILKQFSKFLLKYRNIYRLSNNLFAYCIFNQAEEKNFKETLLSMHEEISNKKFVLNDNVFTLSVNICVGRYTQDETKVILTETEFGLRLAKERKESVLFLEEHIVKIKENQEMIKILKEVIAKDNILAYGQKIINNKTREEKYEILMRLKLEDGSILSPFKFLEVAKKTGLYLSMTRILVKKACDYFKDKNIEFSINLTLEDILDEETITFIFQTIQETKTSHLVTFEIVETEGIDDFQDMEYFIKKAKELSCKIAIDDFGTGYSNFEYIVKLNVDFLKIDGSLIKTFHVDKNLELTVKTITKFASTLGIKVVAEFVHNAEVFAKVQELGIDYSQGYYLHEPERLV